MIIKWPSILICLVLWMTLNTVLGYICRGGFTRGKRFTRGKSPAGDQQNEGPTSAWAAALRAFSLPREQESRALAENGQR